MKKGSFTQLFTVLCYAVAVATELVFSAVIGSLYGSGSLKQGPYVYLTFLIPQACYLLSVTVFILVQRIPAKAVFRPEKVRPTHYIYALLIGLGLFFLALLPNSFLQGLFVKAGSSSTVTLPSMETAGEIILAILIICVLPACGEEMMFRKVFCEGMKGNNEWVIVLFGGLFFSLTHFNLVQTVHQFVLGCALCLLYLRTGNITLTVVAHFLNNLLALFLAGWTEGIIEWDNLATLGIAFAVGAVLFVAGVLLLVKRTQKVKGGESKIEPYTIGLVVVVGIIWAVSVAASFIG